MDRLVNAAAWVAVVALAVAWARKLKRALERKPWTPTSPSGSRERDDEDRDPPIIGWLTKK